MYNQVLAHRLGTVAAPWAQVSLYFLDRHPVCVRFISTMLVSGQVLLLVHAGCVMAHAIVCHGVSAHHIV